MNRMSSIRAAARRGAAVLSIALLLPAWAQAAEITVGEAIYHDTSPPIRDLAPQAVEPGGANREIPIMERADYGRYPDLAEPDGSVQTKVAPDGALAPTPPPIISFQGLSDDDNAATVGTRIVPPDVNGDIGFDGAGNRIYVQYINLIWAVYNANTGARIGNIMAGNTFWSDFGGFCETNNNGDPVVLYDDHAGRWMFSQFSISQGIQCVAVSVTSDPLGLYHRYAFTVTPGGQNDYPKLGVWDDGTTGSTGQSAYTFTTRDFGVSGFIGIGVMERDAMLVGAPAQFIKYSQPCVGGNCLEGTLPPHLAGPTPPANTCPTFWTAVDAAYDDSPFGNDGYRNHTLCVDWGTLGNSTLNEGPLVVAGSNFDRFLGNGFSACISPIAAGGEVLDCLAAFTMYRAQYRWFGSHASVVFNTTVDAGSDRAGIRWSETRSNDGDSAWYLQQDGTYAPADGIERWMGSIAQDGDGNMALGYTAASGTLMPSVRYTTRTAGDAPGAMPGGEQSCIEGTGVQVGSSNRWGDYSSMSVDPVDDCTFWYTQEYYENTNSFDFKTRICSFKLADCGTPPPPDCTVDADCDDGAFCNGAETCDAGICQAGTPPSEDDGVSCTIESCNESTDSIDHVPNDGLCDNSAYCDGSETCDPVNDCQAGTPPVLDDGVGCTDDRCDEVFDVVVHDPNDGLCADEFFCNGAEACDPVNDCQAGSDPCPFGTCNETDDVCEGCGNGICDPGEDCETCGVDCISGTLPGAVCGNGVCEAGDGEDCLSCAADCNGKQNGKPSGRFCCGDGDGENPVSCGDSRCTSGGFACTDIPAPAGGFCCGDGTCEEGPEDPFTCELDCGAPPFCGDNIAEFPEVCDGSDLSDQDCSSLGFGGGTLSCDPDCSGFDTSLCEDAVCGVSGSSCSANSECCSNKCKGKPGNKTCQ